MLSQTQIQEINNMSDLEILSKRKERYEYLGLLSEYQQQPKELVQKLDYTKLNPHQHFLFKRILHGLNIYSQEELDNLHWDKKKRIKKVWLKGQKEVNLWKQEICNKKANAIFSLFYSSTFAKDIVEFSISITDETYINKLTFKDLKIEYDDLILFYISKGLLPKNFLKL